MRRYLARRLLLLIPVWLGITLLAFVLGQLAPGDPARRIAARLSDGQPTAELVERIRHEYGLGDPAALQYLRWAGNAVVGDFGRSFRTGAPVLEELATRFPATLQLAVGALLIGVVLSLPLGMLAAAHRNSIVDHLSRVAALVGASLPSFWLAFLLIIYFSVKGKMLPVAGYGELQHLALPSLTLGIGMAAPLMRLMRSSLLEVLGEDYIQVARAKGLSRRVVVVRHALRNALIPVLTVSGMTFGHLLSGTVIIETIFAWPGIGKLLIDSIGDRDYPLIQGYVLFMGTIFVLINLLVDLLYVWVDPRIRLVEGEG